MFAPLISPTVLKMIMEKQQRSARQAALEARYTGRLDDWRGAEYAKDPRKHGFKWDEAAGYWTRTLHGQVDCLYADPPLPFFLDPEQIRELTPEIDWSRRVGDRIRHFEDWGRAYVG